MKITKVTNIDWSYDYEDFWKALREKTTQKQAEILGIACELYAEMNYEEREAWAYDTYRRKPSVAEEVLNLPTEVDLPDGYWSEETITEYLADTYGTFINGFTLPEIDKEEN